MSIWDRLKSVFGPRAVPDLFERLERLEGSLKEAGLSEDAQRLSDVIASGSTGLEIHMGVRHTLKEIERHTTLPSDLQSTVRQLVRDLNAALR